MVTEQLRILDSLNALPFYEYAIQRGHTPQMAARLAVIAAHDIDGLPYEEMHDAMRSRVKSGGFPYTRDFLDDVAKMGRGDDYLRFLTTFYDEISGRFTPLPAWFVR